MEYTFTQKKYGVVVRISGRILSMADSRELLTEFATWLEKGKYYFVIDLKETEYVNSEGLNVLIKMLTQSRNFGGETIVCHVNKQLRDLFIITKLSSIFTITDTLKEAEEIMLRNMEPSV